MKKKLAIKWTNSLDDDLDPHHNYDSSLQDFDCYLRKLGLRDSTTIRHVQRVKRFLDFAETGTPSLDMFHEYRKHQLDPIYPEAQ